MTIPYHIISRPEAGVKGGGQKKYYASTKIKGEVDLGQIARAIADRSALSSGDVYHVVHSLIDLIPVYLEQGIKVKLNELGSFRITLSSEAKSTKEDISIKSIKGVNLIFHPGKELKMRLKGFGFRKQE